MAVFLKPQVFKRGAMGVSRDEWRKMNRDSMAEVGLEWFENYLPGHFTEGAKYKYKHKPRSKAYRARKLRLAQRGKAIEGGAIDNVLTGASRDALINNVASIRPFPTRVTVYMTAPTYFVRRYKINQPNKPQEVTTVTREEAREFNRIYRDAVAQRIRDYRGQTTVTP